eukprot:scaffold3732_cov129-Isochrysis_galbana.AAC.3
MSVILGRGGFLAHLLRPAQATVTCAHVSLSSITHSHFLRAICGMRQACPVVFNSRCSVLGPCVTRAVFLERCDACACGDDSEAPKHQQLCHVRKGRPGRWCLPSRAISARPARENGARIMLWRGKYPPVPAPTDTCSASAPCQRMERRSSARCAHVSFRTRSHECTAALATAEPTA